MLEFLVTIFVSGVCCFALGYFLHFLLKPDA